MNRLNLFRLFEQRSRRRLRVLMYHRFSEDAHPLRISSAEFERHLKYLKTNARVITIDEAIDGLKGTRPLPDFSTVITIDDGYRDSYEIAYPLLKKYGLPATMYAVSSFLEGKIWLWTDKTRFILEQTTLDRYETFIVGKKISARLSDHASRLNAAAALNDTLKRMRNDDKEKALEKIANDLSVAVPERPPAEYSGFSSREASEMAENGITIGSHTVSHPLMDKINASEQEKEAIDSRRRLEELIGRDVWHFCYPNGSFDRGARTAVEKAGYRSAVSSDFGQCMPGDEIDILRRIPAEADTLAFLQNFTGLEEFKRSIRSRYRTRSAL